MILSNAHFEDKASYNPPQADPRVREPSLASIDAMPNEEEWDGIEGSSSSSRATLADCGQERMHPISVWVAA